MSDNPPYKKQLLELYNQFSLTEESPEQLILNGKIEALLKEIKNPDSDDYHIWGLTYYFTEEKPDISIQKFQKAFQIDPDNLLACLYIGHCYQDLEEWEKALYYYQLTDQKALQDFQRWRYVKLLEQIGFCHAKLGNLEKGRTYFKEVLEWYKKLPEEEIAVPAELLSVLPEKNPIVLKIKEIESYLKES